MKKMIFSILIILSMCGCWNYKELNEYSIVTGVAIDKTNSGYKVSTLISNVSKSSSNSSSDTADSNVVVYEGNGKTIYEAFKDIGKISPKELYLNSFSILIISEEAARDGISNILDFFLRYSSSRNNFDIVIAKDCLAKDTLKILTPITSSPSQNISDNLKTTTALQGAIKTIDFDSLISILISDGIEPSINTIYIVGDEKKGSTNKNLESSEPISYVKLGNIAIFKGDKLIDFATHDESIGINIMENQVNEIYFDIDYKGDNLVIDTTSFKTSINSTVKNNTKTININLEGEARIIESNSKIDLEDSTVIKNIQEKSNQKIKSFVKKAINLSIENKTDILGIGKLLYINHPKYYSKIKNNFEDNLQKINYKINSDITINTKISTKNSLEDSYVR